MSVEGRAERVGYSFQGALTPTSGSAHTYTLFGVTVPDTSPIAGTFSYDTTVDGIITDVGVETFEQAILGGFNWNILNAADQSPILRFSASEYTVTVANDFLPNGSPEAIDYFGVDFNSFTAPQPLPILVNGQPYTKPTALVTASLSWDLLTFNDADEPKLRAELPLETFSSYAGIARTALPATFAITGLSRINPSAGDYNLDGALDSSDYLEWRKAFGESSENFMYADGNADGSVGAADYVLWRKAAINGLGSGTAAQVPEPPVCVMMAIAILFIAAYRRG